MAADYEAWNRAMDALHLLGEPRAKQVAAMLKDEPRASVACFVCSCFQDRNLQVKPWQPLPLGAHLDWLDDGDDGIMGRYAAAQLLEKLFACGISRYEPDPKRAIAAVEAVRRGPFPPPAA